MTDTFELPLTTLQLLGAAGLLLVLILVLVRWWRRSAGKPLPAAPDLGLDISHLEAKGPPADGPRLEFYGTPVRLAVLVIAPAGRYSQLPPSHLLPVVLGQLVPGIAEVLDSHQPLVRRWPEQLSSQGFFQAFFNKVALPGSRGKGTPWCSIAGRLQVGEQNFLVGMVCSAGSPNALGQFTVEHEGQWPDILRIRKDTR
jgi:hypothetical protein